MKRKTHSRALEWKWSKLGKVPNHFHQCRRYWKIRPAGSLALHCRQTALNSVPQTKNDEIQQTKEWWNLTGKYYHSMLECHNLNLDNMSWLLWTIQVAKQTCALKFQPTLLAISFMKKSRGWSASCRKYFWTQSYNQKNTATFALHYEMLCDIQDKFNIFTWI